MNLIDTDDAKVFVNQTIVPFFKGLGFEIDFFPDTGEGDPLWQYDGWEYGNGFFVQVSVGINGHNLPGIFGEVELPDGRAFSISGSCHDWLENYAGPMRLFAKGEAPF